MDSGKTMSYQEMALKFPEEWVLVLEPEVDNGMNVVRGIVDAHSADREVVYDAELRKRPANSAVLCFVSQQAGTGFAF